MIIRLATQQDISAVMGLESRYFVDNLKPSERADGFISILHPREWFDRAVDSAGLHVAVSEEGDESEVRGFMAVTAAPSLSAVEGSPIVRGMLEAAAALEFDGSPLTRQRLALRGPVLIDRAARGRGLYGAFNRVMREFYRGRFDVGLLFVAADNDRSLHTTTTKLGAEPLALFDADGRQYHLLAFRF